MENGKPRVKAHMNKMPRLWQARLNYDDVIKHVDKYEHDSTEDKTIQNLKYIRY